MLQKNYPSWMEFFPACVSGICLTLAFPNVQLSLLALFALIPFFLSIRNMNPKKAFAFGWVTGLVHFLSLIYWIVPTVHIYGGLPIVLAVCTLICLCGYLALYPAFFAWGYRKVSGDGRAWYLPLFGAALWISFEYVRTYAFTGFSWGTLGYSQYMNLPLIQIADVAGVYGVSFLIVLVNAALADLFCRIKERRRPPVLLIGGTVLILGMVLVYGYQKIDGLETQMAAAPKATISVVQGNIKQDVKWDRDFKVRTVDQYIHLSLNAIENQPDLVIWPETALPFYYGVDRPMSGKIDEFVRKSRTHVLFGSPAFTTENEQMRYYNRAYMLNPLSIVTGTYDKNHLVPFGEYVPLGKYLGFLGKITAQAGDFSKGDAQFKPLGFGTNKTGLLICFEILFPSIAAEFVKNGADILTTTTNDAWFGYTSAPRQHFSIAVFRAVENRRSVARAANTGISGFIDPTGKIMAATDLFVETEATMPLAILDQVSFYTEHGDLFAWIALVAICLVFMIKGGKKMFGKKA